MTFRRQIVSGAVWSVVERASAQGISFLVMMILARILGPSQYGLVTLAATIILLGQMLLGETFSDAVIQARRLDHHQISSLFFMLLAAGGAGAVLLVLGAPLLARVFQQPGLEMLLRVLSPLLPLAALQAVPAALFKRDFAFRKLALATTSGTIAGGIAGIGMALSGLGLWSLIGNLLVQNSVVALAIWRGSSFRPHWPATIEITEFWDYGRYTLLLRVAAFIANQGPRLLIGYLFGPAALGAFSLALRLVETSWQVLVVPAVNICIPAIARIRDEKPRLEQAIIQCSQVVAAIISPFFIGLALVAPLLVPFVFGARWQAAVPTIQILSGYGIIGGISLIWASIMRGFGRPDVALGMTCLAAVTGMGSVLIAAHWGPVIAAFAFVVRGCVTLPFQPVLLARLTGISVGRQYRAFLSTIVATVIMALVVLGALSLTSGFAPAGRLCLTVGSGVLAYALGVLVFGRGLVGLGRTMKADLGISRPLS